MKEALNMAVSVSPGRQNCMRLAISSDGRWFPKEGSCNTLAAFWTSVSSWGRTNLPFNVV